MYMYSMNRPPRHKSVSSDMNITYSFLLKVFFKIQFRNIIRQSFTNDNDQLSQFVSHPTAQICLIIKLYKKRISALCSADIPYFFLLSGHLPPIV